MAAQTEDPAQTAVASKKNIAAQTAIVIGSTGLIGESLVKQLSADDYFSEVRLLVRRAVHYDDPKIKTVVVNFNDINDLSSKFGSGDAIFSCVGTTNSQVRGNQAEYRKIDYDIPLNAARIGLSHGFRKFLLVSSVGADASAGNFYLRLKGEIERDLQQLKYPSMMIFRPSLLMGPRKKFRLMEKMIQSIYPAISSIFPRKYSKYRSIHVDDVARAMIKASKQETTGIKVFEYDNMM